MTHKHQWAYTERNIERGLTMKFYACKVKDCPYHKWAAYDLV